MPDVKVWQAVALSMNIDPDSLKGHPQAWMAGPGAGPLFADHSFPSRDEEIKFDKRLRLLVANKTVKNGFSPGTLSMDNPANHGVRLSEFAAWAIKVGMTPLPDELVALTHAQGCQQPQSTAYDEQSCDMVELSRNGALIAWDYWRGRKQITPQQAAELAHCVEPDKGKKTTELGVRIQRLAESLSEHNATWTLSALVKHLGDEVPFNMKQVVASGNGAPAKVDGGATAVKDGKPEHSFHDNASRITTHLVPAPKRTNILDAVIQLAKDSAVKATDWQSVWASLVQIAEAKERPAPLLGFSDDEGVKYQDYSEVKFSIKEEF